MTFRRDIKERALGYLRPAIVLIEMAWHLSLLTICVSFAVIMILFLCRPPKVVFWPVFCVAGGVAIVSCLKLCVEVVLEVAFATPKAARTWRDRRRARRK